MIVEYVPEIHRNKATIPFKSVPPAFHALGIIFKKLFITISHRFSCKIREIGSET